MEDKEKIRVVIREAQKTLTHWRQLTSLLEKEDMNDKIIRQFLNSFKNDTPISEIAEKDLNKVILLFPFLERIASTHSDKVFQLISSLRDYYSQLDYFIPKICLKLPLEYTNIIIQDFIGDLKKKPNYTINILYENLIKILHRIIDNDAISQQGFSNDPILISILDILIQVKAKEGEEALTTRLNDSYLYQDIANKLLAISNIGFQRVLFQYSLFYLDKTGFHKDYLRRPAIEPHEQNKLNEIAEILIDLVRTSAESLIKRNFSDEIWMVMPYEEKPEELSNKPSILQRLYLYLLTKVDDKKRALKFISNKNLFINLALHHEYFYFLKTFYPFLPKDIKEIINGWIIEKLDQGDYRNSKIAAITSFISGDLLVKYQLHQQEIDAKENPEFLTWSIGPFWGPISPITYDELKQKPPKEIIDYLKKFESDNVNWMTPDEEGLAREFEKIVADNYEWFIEDIGILKDLKPIYFTYFFHGLRSSISKITGEQWIKLLRFIKYILSKNQETLPIKTRNIDKSKEAFSWQHTRKEIARVLNIILQPGYQSSLPLDLKEEVFQVLSVLVTDIDPSFSAENEFLQRDYDLSDSNINYTAPLALQTIFYYAVWVFHQLKKNSPGLSSSITFYPEFVSFIENFIKNPPVKLKSYWLEFGRCYPIFLALAPLNAKLLTAKIFPMEDIESLCASWGGYLLSRPSIESLTHLQPIYQFHLENFNFHTKLSQWFERSYKLISRHILFYAFEDLPQTEKILGLLFHPQNLEIACDCTLDLSRFSERLHKDYEKPYQHIWKIFINEFIKMDGEPDLNPLYNFGWAFTLANFERKWHFDNLLTIIQEIGAIRHPAQTIERLDQEKWAIQFPLEIIEILQKLSRSREDEIFYHSTINHMRSIIKQAQETMHISNKSKKQKFEDDVSNLKDYIAVFGHSLY